MSLEEGLVCFITVSKMSVKVKSYVGLTSLWCLRYVRRNIVTGLYKVSFFGVLKNQESCFDSENLVPSVFMSMLYYLCFLIKLKHQSGFSFKPFWGIHEKLQLNLNEAHLFITVTNLTQYLSIKIS